MTRGDLTVFIGLDLGTSGLKAVAVSGDGDVLARAQAPYPTHRPEPGASEQDPASWRAAVREVVAELSHGVPSRRWRAIGLSAMIPTLVTTDSTGDPVRPAITWEDSRAEPDAQELRARIGAEDLYQVTGQRVDGRYLLPMVVRLLRAEPDRMRHATWMLGAKDYLYWWLTGQPATDPSTASGFGAFDLDDGGWSGRVLEAARDLVGVLPRLPDVRAPQSTVPMRPSIADSLGVSRGIGVCLGVADSVAATVGLGTRQLGDVGYIAGTSTVILAVADRPVRDPSQRYLLTPMASESVWGLEMDLLASGSAIRWLAGLLGCGEAELVRLAGTRDPDRGPAFLPYLAGGEQGALWDPTLTGTLTGLGLHHDRADLARALVSGLILESRRCLDVLAEVTRRKGAVQLAGAGVSSATFAQDLADATGRAVQLPDGDVDRSALGAARLAAGGKDPGFAGESDPRPAVVRLPVEAARVSWDRLARRQDETLAAFRTQGQRL
ncbi:MAG: xylulokinase [Nocardioidaceae bacterium]